MKLYTLATLIMSGLRSFCLNKDAFNVPWCLCYGCVGLFHSSIVSWLVDFTCFEFSLKRVISLVGDDYKHLWLFHSDGNELYVLAALIVTSLRF